MADNQGAAAADTGATETTQPIQQDFIVYTCGDCGEDQDFRAGDSIICRDCGYRIMYKKRTKRMQQFDAR